MLNGNELKGKIVSRYGSCTAFSEAVGWDKSKISRYIKGKRIPDLEDVKTISLALNLNLQEFKNIFLPWM